MLSALIGLGGFAWIFYYVANNHADHFGGFYNTSAAILVGLSPILICFISHGVGSVFISLFEVIKIMFTSENRRLKKAQRTLIELNQAVKSEGLGQFANFKEQSNDKFFKDAIGLVLAGMSNDDIRHHLSEKIHTKQSRYSFATNLFENLSRICPGVGLIGTIIGLVFMLSNLSDPSSIGSGMAVSLLATLYGLAFGTVLYSPLSEKINIFAQRQEIIDHLILEGILLVRDKKAGNLLTNLFATYNFDAHKKTAANFQNQQSINKE